MLTIVRSHVNIVKKNINGQAHLTDISVGFTENDTNGREIEFIKQFDDRAWWTTDLFLIYNWKKKEKIFDNEKPIFFFSFSHLLMNLGFHTLFIESLEKYWFEWIKP